MTTLQKLAGKFKSQTLAQARQAERVIDLSQADDETLVARVQNGDVAAYDHLVQRYKERVYATVYHMTGNHEDTNDLVQEAFIKAYKSIGGFKRESSFYTWIYRIAVNRTLNHLKRGKNRFHFSLDDVERRLDGLGLLDRDGPVFADFVHGVRDDAPDRRVGVRRDGRDVGNLVLLLDVLGALLDVVGRDLDVY